ncbi:hypothetical protein J1N35_018654 [Gossypium stocksii]|uniref:Uncharacterized protein n=1 Tax=Gossypium stocksii TaxID=47602 RepID=A0A9D3VQH1_9ROSI|nr:hypothetical protein J1N35_018654 [Gossypium stocksii]
MTETSSSRPSVSKALVSISLIQNSLNQVREYVQASKFDSHLITGDTIEKFVNLEIPLEFPKEWSDVGYTHIHFGAIRLALNYHGTEGDRFATCIDRMDHNVSKPRKRESKKNSSQDEFCKRYMNRDPSIGPLGEDNGKFFYLIDYFAKLPQPNQNLPADSDPLPPPKSGPLPAPKRPQKSLSLPQYVCMYVCINLQIHHTNTNFHPYKNSLNKGILILPKFPPIQTDESGKPAKISTSEATLN